MTSTVNVPRTSRDSSARPACGAWTTPVLTEAVAWTCRMDMSVSNLLEHSYEVKSNQAMSGWFVQLLIRPTDFTGCGFLEMESTPASIRPGSNI